MVAPAPPPTAERRAALVIGNAAYAEGPLANPVHDATDMAHALQQLGFAVTVLRDADRQRMREAIETFGKVLRPGVVGLFSFAGHGLQVKGENYLVPIGARIGTRTGCRIRNGACGANPRCHGRCGEWRQCHHPGCLLRIPRQSCH